MIVRDLKSICYDNVVIYTNTDEKFYNFEDLYKGTLDNAPDCLLDKEIRCIGAKRKGIVDISVRR